MDILEVKQNLNKTVYYSDFYNIPEPTPFILNACIARKDPRGFLKYSLELLDKTKHAVIIVPIEKVSAEKVHRKTYDSYRITKCPEYVPDKVSNSENKKKTRVTNKELDTMKRLRDDGLSYFEIAKIVDRNPDVVRVNLVRC